MPPQEAAQYHWEVARLGCRKPWLAPCALLVLGAACTGYGILRGEPAIVLQKAVSICMECIGIG